ncbi:hypothetical protein, partial [Aeromonas caviae]
QAGKWDQETIVSFFLCQYCSGEYLRSWGGKPKPPKIPSTQFQPRHDRIQIDNLTIAVKGIVPVQVNMAGLVDQIQSRILAPQPAGRA